MNLNELCDVLLKICPSLGSVVLKYDGKSWYLAVYSPNLGDQFEWPTTPHPSPEAVVRWAIRGQLRGLKVRIERDRETADHLQQVLDMAVEMTKYDEASTSGDGS